MQAGASEAAAPASPMQAQARWAAAPAFVLAMFMSAALIFALQPLFSRMTTPLLGGSPAVWNTSMVFFQAALLAGYLYAHFLQRVGDLRVQAAIHAAVLVAAFAFLPVHVAFPFGATPDTTRPIAWLFGALTISIGAPFAAASATAPLLQAWYARTGRADAHDPYYLYAASNLGSLLGLILYPVLVEPLMGARAQADAWTYGYGAAALAIVACGLVAIAAKGAPPAPAAPAAGHASWRERLYWLAAAALPSSLLLGVTQHITTDVASAPFLWVVPLALYLVTFIIAFLRRSERLTPAVLFAHPLSLGGLAMALMFSGIWLVQLTAYLAAFFFSALVCHLALARTRPAAARLTEFYICVSAGGVLGGAATALLAPVVFNGIYEFPLALAAIALFRPRSGTLLPKLSTIVAASAAAMTALCVALVRVPAPELAQLAGGLGAAGALVAVAVPDEDRRPLPLRIAFMVCAVAFAGVTIVMALDPSALPVGLSALPMSEPLRVAAAVLGFLLFALALHAALLPDPEPQLFANIALGLSLPLVFVAFAAAVMQTRFDHQQMLLVAMAVMTLALFLNRNRPVLLAALVLALFAALYVDDVRGARIVRQERSFFGVLQVEEWNTGRYPMRVLMHGTTIHGAQLVGEGVSRAPLTYYNSNTALGEATRAGLAGGPKSRLALVGLGTGTTACLLRPQDELTVFEIDPTVVRLSGPHGSMFTYVRQCQPNARIVLGDARLRLAEQQDGLYDVIVVDAFSSDAIPAHLLTREAVAMYARKLTPRGVIVLHLSNRNLALVAEAARVASALELPHRWRVSFPQDDQANSYIELAASAMILARTQDAMDALPLQSNEWLELTTRPGRPWTDDYINLPRALWENWRGVS
jgi:spermidine synthase